MTTETAPSCCGACSYMAREDHIDPTMGIVNLFTCKHPSTPTILFVMPSELSERCPLPQQKKHGKYLPSPAERPGLSEEAIFMIEALRWYVGEYCEEKVQEAVDSHLSHIWTNDQFIQYHTAIRTVALAMESNTFSIIYQSILGYRDVNQQVSQAFSKAMEEVLFDKEP